MQQPHVGMKVWVFDVGQRVHARDAEGNAVGGPIWRKYWVEQQIIGETKRSWLIGPEWMREQLHRARKIFKGKKFPPDILASEAEIDRAAFISNRHRIAERIYSCRDYETLMAVSDILDGTRKSLHNSDAGV